jgi:hypothetical protein
MVRKQFVTLRVYGKVTVTPHIVQLRCTNKKKTWVSAGVVAHVCNTVTWKAEAGTSGLPCKPGLSGDFLDQENKEQDATTKEWSSKGLTWITSPSWTKG